VKKSLEAKQAEMRKRQKIRQRQTKPMLKSELIELLTKRIRNEKTNSQGFASMTRQLAELKGWCEQAKGSLTKPRNNPVENIEDPKPVDEGDIYEQVLAEEARRTQANEPEHS